MKLNTKKRLGVVINVPIELRQTRELYAYSFLNDSRVYKSLLMNKEVFDAFLGDPFHEIQKIRNEDLLYLEHTE